MTEQKDMKFLISPIVLGCLLAFFVAGCSRSQATPPGESTSTGPATPQVTADRTDLIFSWIGDGGPQVATSVDEVPQDKRSKVRVQDPSIPPEKRDTKWLFFADLRAPDTKGAFPVQAIERSAYEAERNAASAAQSTEQARGMGPSPSGSGPVPGPVPGGQKNQGDSLALKSGANSGTGPVPGPDTGATPVIMYSTRHCPVCVKARRWLLAERIPYIEKDIERDREAAKSLAAKGQKQGVPVNGVPVFEIRGTLIPGFDPAIIKRLVRGQPATERTI